MYRSGYTNGYHAVPGAPGHDNVANYILVSISSSELTC